MMYLGTAKGQSVLLYSESRAACYTNIKPSRYKSSKKLHHWCLKVVKQIQLLPHCSPAQGSPTLHEKLLFPYLQVVGPILQGIGGCRNDAVLSQLGLKRADYLVCVLNLSLQVQGSLSSGKGENKGQG